MSYRDDESGLKFLIDRYQQKIFALVLYLVGGDRNKTYNIATAAFAYALQTTSPIEGNDAFLTTLARKAIEQSRRTKSIPVLDDSDFTDLRPSKKEPLKIVKKALLSLAFDMKAVLLLRDQLHLPYKNIAAILGQSETSVKTQTSQAHLQLRHKVEKVLRHG